MTDLLDRLRKRQSTTGMSLMTMPGNLNAAAACAVIPGLQQSGTFTIGGPDTDIVEAIAEIERLRGCLSEGQSALAFAQSEIVKATEKYEEAVIDRNETDEVLDKLRDLLHRTAIALKGPEKPLTRHSFHDLPELAGLAKELAAQAMDTIREKEAYAEETRAHLQALCGAWESNMTTVEIYDPLIRKAREVLNRRTEIGILCPDCGGIGTRMVPFTVDDADACPTCNGLGELPPRSSDPEDTAPAPPCPDCQGSHAVGQSDTPRCRAIDRKHNAMRDRLPPFPGCLEVSAIEDARNSAFVALAHTLERELSRCHSQVPKQEPTT